MSVAKICTFGAAASFSKCSRNRIAVEYASSPVEQPVTQTVFRYRRPFPRTVSG
jgi:hypothetical protein